MFGWVTTKGTTGCNIYPYFKPSVPEGGSSRKKILLGTGVVDG